MKIYTRHDTSRIGLILPTYDGQSSNRLAVVNFNNQFPDCKCIEVTSSALGHCFNVGYQALLKFVEQGTMDYILMLHADCVPMQQNWGQILIDELIDTKASVISVVVPIKSQAGLTSTGVMRNEDIRQSLWHPIRFTMKEVMDLPETFTHPHLIVNTGIMAIDARQEWAKKLVFDLRSFVHLETKDCWYIPEDWLMSKMCWESGGTVWATRKVAMEHKGNVGFPNTSPWGITTTEGAMEVYVKEGGTTPLSTQARQVESR